MAAQIFIVVAHTNVPAVKGAIERLPENTFYPFKEDTWFVEYEGTSQELAAKLGIEKGENGKGFVGGLKGYYGFGSTSIWEWLKSHWPKVS